MLLFITLKQGCNLNCGYCGNGSNEILIENTFTSLDDLVYVMFPFLKYLRKYLLSSKFETLNIIGKIERHILLCRSENDELIPNIQMNTLYNSAKRALFKKYYMIHQSSHNDGFRTDIIEYAIAIHKFMDECDNYYKNLAKNKINEKEGVKEKEGDKDISYTKENCYNNKKIIEFINNNN